MIFKYFVAILLISTARARSSSTSLNEIPHEARSEDSSNSFVGDLRYAYKVYKECASADLSPCLKLKLVSAMDRAFRSYGEFSLMDGVKFVKNAKDHQDVAPKTEADIEATLPRGLDRENVLNSLILEKVSNFLDTFSLQVKLPSAADLQRSLSDESRAKKKKSGNVFLIPLILGGTLIPLAIGALALLAGKAFIVSKVALVLAAVLGLKKLFGSSGSGNQPAPEVVMAGPVGGATWARSYDREQAQKMAYNAYAAQTTR